jgi:hypothetical protein
MDRLTMHNPIIELHAEQTVSDISQHISALTSCVGFLVIENEAVDCRAMSRDLPVSCAAIAFVSQRRLRFRQRMSVNLELSRHHACPCRVFTSHTSAYLWLQQQVNRMP